MNKPTVLILFNSSPYAPQPWLDDGRFNVVSVDYCETDHSDAHKFSWSHPRHHRLNIDLSQPGAKYSILLGLHRISLDAPRICISFPPCTDLAVSGARHFKAKLEKDPECQNRAVTMARLASKFNCPYVVENPVSLLSSLWRRQDTYVHPWEFTGYIGDDEIVHPEFPGIIPDGDMYYKKTGLWFGNGFIMPHRMHGGAPTATKNPGWEKLGGKSARTKYIRSLTPRGLSRAIYHANMHHVLTERVN